MAARAELLEALAAQLGEPPDQVAATLLSELQRAVAQIDAGLADGDREAVDRATHAARNSVLMLDDRPMLDALRALDDAAGRGDSAGAGVARVRLGELWDALATELRAISAA